MPLRQRAHDDRRLVGWSRDGQWIYAASDRSGAWQLWRMHPDGTGPETRVLDDLALPDWGNWAVTEGGLYFVRRSGDGTTIAFHDFATGSSRAVASIPNIASPSLEVSPDGRRLLEACTRRQQIHVQQDVAKDEHAIGCPMKGEVARTVTRDFEHLEARHGVALTEHAIH